MQVRILLPVALTLALVACDRPKETPKTEPAPATAPAPATTPAPTTETSPAGSLPSLVDTIVTFSCPDGHNLTVRFHDQRADFSLAGQSLSLPQVVSASGARYSDEQTTLWNKGREVFIEQAGKPDMTCQDTSGND
ncbi:MliC family protein [Govanella unica]|uniref:MliC family protein n=1 Tax=Govanella unica TaxID=2975056 RepID=A0A9X3TX28_9PROT|nr:MliC family protein [Govania unica]MDA5193270.1 MliC family protein [Govania unica]